MLGIMMQKLLSKKWMFICLLLGSVLLVATLVSFPMYQSAVFDRMLRDQFKMNLLGTDMWPARLDLEANSEFMSHDAIHQAEETMAGIGELLGVDTKENISLYSSIQPMKLDSGRTDAMTYNMSLACMSELQDHAVIRSGEMYSGDGFSPEGSIEVIISEDLMKERNLLVGDILSLTDIRKEDGSYVKAEIVGIFGKNEGDYYWDMVDDELSNVLLMPESVFRKEFMKTAEDNYNVFSCKYCYLFEYESMEASQAPGILEILEESDFAAETTVWLLEQFMRESTLISATLFVLQMPVLVLLGAFLLMVSRQMYELEKNEISVIKSRGSSGAQIFRLYLYQSMFLAAAGALLGFPLGIAFVQGLGSASNFLEFGLRRSLEIKISARVWMYLAAAVMLTVLILTIPAVRHSRVSIVNLKQRANDGKKSWWERFFVDFVCLAAGVYGYYNYSRNQEELAETVLMGQSLDPLLYISSALFIVGMGLLFLRLQPLLVKLVYLAGRRFWHPSSYASFIESLRSGRKQQFIMLFLILTVSLGIFYATVARTILQNARNEISYRDGADLIIREVWKDNGAAVISYSDQGVDLPPRYEEPSLLKYDSLGVKSYTKVINSASRGTSAYIKTEKGTQYVTLFGIHTREFGENTRLDRELNPEHYYTYLNALADEPEGVLLSRNFETQEGWKIGDRIKYGYNSIMRAVVGGEERTYTNYYETEGKVVGFVDYWPGFVPRGIYIDYNGEVGKYVNSLMVVNIAALQEVFGTVTEPYELWITLEEGVSPEDAAEWIRANDVGVEKYVNRQEDLQDTAREPLLQGTNGVLTMSFLVMILLCAAGYLIYWVMSIRSRELVFGTLRAFGMHKGELFHMLILEQIFSGALSVFAGVGIGRLASVMFVPMIQTAYAASNQVLPMHLYTNPEDFLRLYGALGLVMAVCLAVLIGLVFKLNVTKALKLGEE